MLGQYKNIQIGSALVTVFEPFKICYKCKSASAASTFGKYKSCFPCREKQRLYMENRERLYAEKRAEQKRNEEEAVARRLKRSELLDECFRLYPDYENKGPNFDRWAQWYSDEIEKTGKFVAVLFEDPIDADFEVELWHELLTLWHNLGKPEAPENWSPEE